MKNSGSLKYNYYHLDIDIKKSFFLIFFSGPYLSPQCFVAHSDVIVCAFSHGVALREALLNVFVGCHQSVTHFSEFGRYFTHGCNAN